MSVIRARPFRGGGSRPFDMAISRRQVDYFLFADDSLVHSRLIRVLQLATDPLVKHTNAEGVVISPTGTFQNNK